MKQILVLLAFILIQTTTFAQVGVNTDNTNPDASAMLDVKSTDKGMLVPRMTTTQRTMIASPAVGLLVFDVTTTSFWFYDGTGWIALGIQTIRETCYDGIQNQDETDIDCGGKTCNICQTCDDGIQNQNETDVDCGGSCAPCVQELLDGGTTPLDVINVHGHLLEELYGKTYQGGLIFYLNTTDGTGLVVTPTDLATDARWGCNSTSIPSTTSYLMGSGAQNTADIVASCTTYYGAANYCDDLVLGGYSDWFLPSIDELKEIWLNLVDPDGNHSSGPNDPNNLGGFQTTNYWSSSAVGTDAWYRYFGSNYTRSTEKWRGYSVRAARAF